MKLDHIDEPIADIGQDHDRQVVKVVTDVGYHLVVTNTMDEMSHEDKEDLWKQIEELIEPNPNPGVDAAQIIANVCERKHRANDGGHYLEKQDILRERPMTDKEYREFLGHAKRLNLLEKSGRWWRVTMVPYGRPGDYLRMRQREDSFSRKIFPPGMLDQPADPIGKKVQP